jgi:hypothetical protein
LEDYDMAKKKSIFTRIVIITNDNIRHPNITSFCPGSKAPTTAVLKSIYTEISFMVQMIGLKWSDIKFIEFQKEKYEKDN